jgi:hypothetical protein
MSVACFAVTGWLTTTAGLLERELIEAGLRAAECWLPSTDNSQFVRGAIAAYRWLLGEAAAPVSGETTQVSVGVIRP